VRGARAASRRERSASGGNTVNKIEALKAERDGLDVTEDLVRFAREGWRTLADDDKERLKWVGVFHRKPTPGHFMMRIRMPNGIVTTAQARLLGEITKATGRNIADVTTRQQVQLRWLTIEGVPDVIGRLEAAGLSSLQTGMDNIRGIVGCPATGLTPRELTLRVVVDEGRLYRQGTVTWTGNKLVPTYALDHQWSRQTGSVYSHAHVQKALQGAYSEYMERGYLYLNIEPRDSVVQDSIVDLTPYIGHTVTLRFTMANAHRDETGGPPPSPGWAIDDVEVCAADAACEHAEERLSRAGLRIGQRSGWLNQTLTPLATYRQRQRFESSTFYVTTFNPGIPGFTPFESDTNTDQFLWTGLGFFDRGDPSFTDVFPFETNDLDTTRSVRITVQWQGLKQNTHNDWAEVRNGSNVYTAVVDSAVWTGRKLLVWGGGVGGWAFADGAAFRPAG